MNYDPYQTARKKVKAKKGFYGHFSAYIAVGLFFLAINLLTWDGEFWFFFPMLGWGIGLAIHYFTVFGLPGTDVLTSEWESREMEKELRRMGHQPLDHYEEDPDDELDLREMQQEKTERRLDEEDFV